MLHYPQTCRLLIARRESVPDAPTFCDSACVRADLWKIDILFVIGGRGGNAAAEMIHRECRGKTVRSNGGQCVF